MFRELLVRNLGGIADPTAEQIAALEAHYELLQRWNRVLNLTSVRSVEEAVVRHYCESIFLAVHLPPGPLAICDIGSGAGFPGFPVAVFRPDCSVTLIEAHQRKAVFLKESTRQLANIRVLPKRAEQVGESFDHAISRAVSYEDLMPTLKKLAQYADLLTGAEVPPPKLGFSWQPAIPLPWGSQRLLRIGVRMSEAGVLLR